MVYEKDVTKKEWQEQKVGLGLNETIFDVKIWVISEMFKVAKEKTWQIHQLYIISILCDSQTIIQIFETCYGGVGQELKIQIH